MKYFYLLFLLSINAFSQTEIGNFKIEQGEVVWQKIFEEDLPIESQDLKLKAVGLPLMTTTFWLSDIEGAKMKVEHKDNRTRITINDIYSISSTKINLGQVEENIKPIYAEEIYVSKNGVFKKFFLKKDGKLIEEIINREINNLIKYETEDDW